MKRKRERTYIGNIGHLKSIIVMDAVEKKGGRRTRDHVVSVVVVVVAAMIEFTRANVENVIANYGMGGATEHDDD